MRAQAGLKKDRLTLSAAFIVGFGLWWTPSADAQALKATVTELSTLPAMRPKFPVPNEPHQLFYLERSVNANTVIYAARVDARGVPDSAAPVDVYWRWYNVDGHKKSLNFIERLMAYGVSLDRAEPGRPISFGIVALPSRKLLLEKDSHGHPEALLSMGDRLARLVYVYLTVDDSGLMPVVNAIDIFAIDAAGKVLHEHDVRA